MLILNQVSNGIIKNLSFYIGYGEYVYLFSKDNQVITELFKLLRGTIKPESGVINWINNKGKPGHPKSDIGVVFKENILLPDRNLKENLQYIMEIKNLDMTCADTRIKRILEVVDLFYCRQKKPVDLLPHQLVRANIAQAILNYPSVLILEEPTRKLDQVNTQAIIHLLRELNKLSMTIILLSSKNLPTGKGIRTINLKENIDSRKRGFYA